MRMVAVRSWRGLPIHSLAPLAFLVLVGAVRSGEAATIPLHARVILATDHGSGTDAGLKDIEKQLDSAIKRRRYELLATHRWEAQLAQPWRASLPGDRSFEVTPTAIAQGDFNLQVRVLASGGQLLMSTNVRLPSGRIVFIAGPPHGPGILVITLSAQ
jgi:hypothetical protein